MVSSVWNVGDATNLLPLSVSSITQADSGGNIHRDLPHGSHPRAIADFEPTAVLRDWGID